MVIRVQFLRYERSQIHETFTSSEKELFSGGQSKASKRDLRFLCGFKTLYATRPAAPRCLRHCTWHSPYRGYTWARRAPTRRGFSLGLRLACPPRVLTFHATASFFHRPAPERSNAIDAARFCGIGERLPERIAPPKNSPRKLFTYVISALENYEGEHFSLVKDHLIIISSHS